VDDKSRILAYLETDRLYAAYAIGDLEPGMYEQCAWAVAEREGRLQALVLHYRGLAHTPLLLFGAVDGLRAILAETLCPERVYLGCLDEHLSIARAFYTWKENTPMWRMALDPARFRNAWTTRAYPPSARDAPVRLAPSQAGQLAALYALGGGGAFNSAQVEQGVFYGLFSDGQLVAAAGTHLVSPTYGVGAVGNVYVHPDHRGRGHGTAVVSAVVAELLDRGIRDVVLNVGRDNAPAIHLYEKLGFEHHCPFLEGPATRTLHREAQRG
jgi:ribosomal protein S18 acetylase RimI-like enzyme